MSDPITTLSTILGLSFASGINLYATVAVAGFSIRNNLVTGLPPELNILAEPSVIGVAIVLYVIEFFADKIPGLDTLWDLIHTFLRPLAGAALALGAVGDADPVFKVIAVLIGTAVSSTTHFTKTTTRMVVNTSPEPFSNAAISLAEDVGAASISYMAFAHPYPTGIVVIILLGLIFYFIPKLIQFTLFWASAIISSPLSLLSKQAVSDAIPQNYWNALKLKSLPTLYSKCFIRSTPNTLKNVKGYIILQDNYLLLAAKQWFRISAFKIPLTEIQDMQIIKKLLYIIAVLYTEKGPIHLLFYKNRMPLLNMFQEGIEHAKKH